MALRFLLVVDKTEKLLLWMDGMNQPEKWISLNEWNTEIDGDGNGDADWPINYFTFEQLFIFILEWKKTRKMSWLPMKISNRNEHSGNRVILKKYSPFFLSQNVHKFALTNLLPRGKQWNNQGSKKGKKRNVGCHFTELRSVWATVVRQILSKKKQNDKEKQNEKKKTRESFYRNEFRKHEMIGNCQTTIYLTVAATQTDQITNIACH